MSKKRRLPPSQRKDAIPDLIRLWDTSPQARIEFCKSLPPSFNAMLQMAGLTEDEVRFLVTFAFARASGHKRIRIGRAVYELPQSAEEMIADLWVDAFKRVIEREGINPEDEHAATTLIQRMEARFAGQEGGRS